MSNCCLQDFKNLPPMRKTVNWLIDLIMSVDQPTTDPCQSSAFFKASIVPHGSVPVSILSKKFRDVTDNIKRQACLAVCPLPG